METWRSLTWRQGGQWHAIKISDLFEKCDFAKIERVSLKNIIHKLGGGIKGNVDERYFEKGSCMLEYYKGKMQQQLAKIQPIEYLQLFKSVY